MFVHLLLALSINRYQSFDYSRTKTYFDIPHHYVQNVWKSRCTEDSFVLLWPHEGCLPASTASHPRSLDKTKQVKKMKWRKVYCLIYNEYPLNLENKLKKVNPICWQLYIKLALLNCLLSFQYIKSIVYEYATFFHFSTPSSLLRNVIDVKLSRIKIIYLRVSSCIISWYDLTALHGSHATWQK